MLLLFPVLAACFLALLLGGSTRGFANLNVRNSSLIAGSLLIQVAIYLPVLRHSRLVLGHAEGIYLLALCLAIVVMARNWHLGLPIRVATLGLLLNATVIAANSGHMPVNMSALALTQGSQAVQTARDAHTYGNTRPADSSSRLLLLSDAIPVSVPGYGGNVYSPGDVLIASGVACFVFVTLRRPVATVRRAPTSPHTLQA